MEAEHRRRVYIPPDESFETRRKNILEHLKSRATRQSKVTEVSKTGVLTIDGVNDFPLKDGFLNARTRGSSSNDG